MQPFFWHKYWVADETTKFYKRATHLLPMLPIFLENSTIFTPFTGFYVYAGLKYQQLARLKYWRRARPSGPVFLRPHAYVGICG